MKAFFLTSPHSGEDVPTEVNWLQDLPEPILMCDVDRYVDQLYQPVAEKLNIPLLKARWHRYVVDLNRFADDTDPMSVEGSATSTRFAAGMGVHWAETTKGFKFLKQPLSVQKHKELIAKYFDPFHEQIEKQFSELRKQGADHVYHIDCHSMPSQGGAKHNDQGQKRPDVVVSDLRGQSSEARFKDLVISSYEAAGFQISYNWPYIGGRLTEKYGQPAKGQSTIQVELNRSLYMNEETKKKNELFSDTAKRLGQAIENIQRQVSMWSQRK